MRAKITRIELVCTVFLLLWVGRSFEKFNLIYRDIDKKDVFLCAKNETFNKKDDIILYIYLIMKIAYKLNVM